MAWANHGCDDDNKNKNENEMKMKIETKNVCVSVLSRIIYIEIEKMQKKKNVHVSA